MGSWHSSLKYSSADSLLDSDAASYVWDGNLELPTAKAKNASPAGFTNAEAAPNMKKKAAIKQPHLLHQPLVVVTKSNSDLNTSQQNGKKRVKIGESANQTSNLGPIGMKWNAANYSCAYDTWFTILRSIWISNPAFWSKSLAAYGNELATLVQGFADHLEGKCTIEVARDRVRSQLYCANPSKFPMGFSFISLHDLITQCIEVVEIGKTHLVCTHCPCTVNDGIFRLQNLNVAAGNASPRRVQYRDDLTISHLIYAAPDSTHYPCYRCTEIRLLNRSLKLHNESDLLMFEIVSNSVLPEPTIALDSINGSRKLYTLRGLAYHGSNHFTSRLVDAQGQVWYNDGATTGNSCILEGNLNGSSNLKWLQQAHGKVLTYAFYAIHI
jgi:hypothetical protein